MKLLAFRSLVLFSLLVLAAGALAQNAEDSTSSFGRPAQKDNEPKGLRENLIKMQIEREKKDFQEMLDRGEEAAKLADQIETSVERGGSLTNEDRQKIDNVEKLVKKIRGELGGSDDDGDAPDKDDPSPNDVVSGVKYLRDSATKLLDELKKSSRFTISAAAIRGSNAVLRAARFLRFGK